MSHHCHAVGCTRSVPPKLFMCAPHWRMVPRDGQQAVWREYRPGQEEDKRPTWRYLVVTNECRRIVALKEGKTAQWEAEKPSYDRTIQTLKDAARRRAEAAT